MDYPDGIEKEGEQAGPGRGRPPLWDRIEIVGCISALIDQGKTVGAAAQIIAEQMSQKIAGERDRDFRKRVKARADSIERAYRVCKLELDKPWSDDPSGEGFVIGPMLFNGRPVPKPIGLYPQIAPKRGRPPKRH